AIVHALPIPFFILGVAVGVVVGTLEERAGLDVRFGPTLVLEALVLGAFVLLARGMHEKSGAYFALTVAMPVLAMGLQNATLRRIGSQGVRTTFITGMLTDFAEHLTKALLRTGPIEPALLTGSIWLVYLAGAAAGGFLHLRIGVVSTLLPIAVLLIIAAAEFLTSSRLSSAAIRQRTSGR
ncbi:MAG: YoaK family protein, partial [Vulcanimicrobiaceae bacterium]